MATRAGRAQPAKINGEPAGKGDTLEAADFIGQSVGELAQLARRHSLETLGYLLEMARMEADEAIRQWHGRQG